MVGKFTQSCVINSNGLTSGQPNGWSPNGWSIDELREGSGSEQLDRIAGMDGPTLQNPRHSPTAANQQLWQMIIDAGDRAAGSPLFRQLEDGLANAQAGSRREGLERHPHGEEIGTEGLGWHREALLFEAPADLFSKEAHLAQRIPTSVAITGQTVTSDQLTRWNRRFTTAFLLPEMYADDTWHYFTLRESGRGPEFRPDYLTTGTADKTREPTPIDEEGSVGGQLPDRRQQILGLGQNRILNLWRIGDKRVERRDAAHRSIEVIEEIGGDPRRELRPVTP